MTKRRLGVFEIASKTSLESAAILYSLIASCKLADVEPRGYFRDVLIKLAEDWPQSKIGELVPSAWAELHGPAPATTTRDVAHPKV